MSLARTFLAVFGAVAMAPSIAAGQVVQAELDSAVAELPAALRGLAIKQDSLQASADSLQAALTRVAGDASRARQAIDSLISDAVTQQLTTVSTAADVLRAYATASAAIDNST